MKNDYIIRGNEVVIYLDRKDGTRLETIIDLASLDRVKQFKSKWKSSRKNIVKNCNGQYYANACVKRGGKWKNYYLHRWVLGYEGDEVVDHIDGDTLNNRLSNLRVVSMQANNINRRGANKNSLSDMRNIRIRNNKYQARVKINYKEITLGTFITLEEAQEVIDKFYNDYWVNYNKTS